ncbi:hypothetical protein [Paraglaciecola hydrolytica]|nr:hypothetical protein [Paraglaciecola hydrolytica]
MQNAHYLITLCQRLHQMGKKPSVALIRQYADRSLAIPEIVKALQSWKVSPALSIEEEQTTAPSTTESSLEARVSTLETLVAQLSAQLEALHKP